MHLKHLHETMKIKTIIKKPTFKNLFYLALISIVSIACGSRINSKKAENFNTMEGVWELSEFYHLANGDTLIVDTSKVQHKIYLDGYVIWNTDPAPDATEWHAYGTYTYKNDTITEKLTSTSKSMKSDINTYVIPIERGKDSYKQVNTYKNNDTIYHNIEVYKKIN